MNLDERHIRNIGNHFGKNRYLQLVLLFLMLSSGNATAFPIYPPLLSNSPDSITGVSEFDFITGPPLGLKWDHGPVSIGMVMDIGFISCSATDSSDLLISRIWSGLFRYKMPEFNERLLMQTPDKLCDAMTLMFHPTEWTGDSISDLIAADRDGFIYLLPATGTPPDIRYEKSDENVLRDHTGRDAFKIPFENPGLPRQNDLGGYTDPQYSNYLFPRVYQCAGNRHKDLIIGDAAGNLWWLPDMSEGIGRPLYDGIVYSKQPTAHRIGSEYQSKFGLDYVKPAEKIEDETGKPFLLGEGLESGKKYTGSMARPFLYPGQSGELTDLIVMAGAVRQKVSYLKRVNPPEERKPVFREIGEVTISGLDISLLNCHSRLCMIQKDNRRDLLLTSGNYIALLEFTGDENGIPGFRFSGWISGEHTRASGYVFTEILTDTTGNRYVLDFTNYFWKPVRIIPGDDGITLHYASDSLRILDQNGTFTVPGETDPQFSPAWGYHRITRWNYDGSGRQHLIAATDKGHLYLLEDDPALKKQDQFMYRSVGLLRDSTGKVIRVHNRATAVAIDLNDDGIDDLIVGGISYQLGIKSDPDPGGGIFYILNLGADTQGVPVLTPPLPLDVGPDFKPRINSHISLQMFDLDHDGDKEMILSLQDKGWNGRIYSKVPGKTAFTYTGRQIPMESIVEQLIDIDGDGQCEIVRPGDETGVGYYRKLVRQTSDPEPLLTAYFPDRLHAFIWRNWQLIPADKLAEVVKTHVKNINTIAFSMGLPPQENVTPELAKRSYVTIIKRNWHLLPYNQLLELPGWNPEMLSTTLMENDFLFHKLGDIKPDCDPLCYTQPDETDADAERKIAQVIREEFPEGINCSGDILFRFPDELKRPPDEPGSSLSQPKNSTIRICYSYYSSFGYPLLDKEKDPYPEAYLQKLSECGINGIWISGILYKLPPFPWDSGLSRGYELRLQNLRETGIEGIMASWTLGGYPSPNLDVLKEMTENPGITIDDAMISVAEKWFGRDTAPHVVNAWCGYSRAFSHFPYHQTVVYRAPLQNGPSNLIWAEPTNFKSSMVGFAYDDLDKWRAVYPPEVFVALLDSVADGFDRTMTELSGNVNLEEYKNTNLAREIDIARTVSIHMKSVSNQSRFILLRDKLNTAETHASAVDMLNELELIAADEIKLAKELYKIQLHDSRIGFEASNQYYYIPVDLVEKVLNCRYLIDTWLPEKKNQFFQYYHENE